MDNTTFKIYLLYKTNVDNLDYIDMMKFFISKGFKYYEEKNGSRLVNKNIILGYSYSFHCTKYNNIPDIYKISSEYSDANIYLEMPLVVSTYLFRRTTDLLQEFCGKFGLVIYHESFGTAIRYSGNDLEEAFIVEKRKYEEENRELVYKKTKQMKTVVINNLFSFCNKKDSTEYQPFGGGCEVRLMRDKNTQQWKIAIVWVVDEPKLFWNEYDCVYVRKDGKDDVLVEAVDFKKVLGKCLKTVKVNDKSSDMELTTISGKNVKKASKLYNKLISSVVTYADYLEEVPLSRIVDI